MRKFNIASAAAAAGVLAVLTMSAAGASPVEETITNPAQVGHREVWFYDNTTGIATDSFFAGGHPGYPQDSSMFERNRIYSNNFNVYAPGSDVKSAVPVPIGVGILIAGGDDDTISGNYIYDNWRRGTMLIAVPDAISCAPNPDEGAPPCTPQGAATTSNGDRYYDNVMSRTPDGRKMPNGVDFWWDEFPNNTGNCWYSNRGPDGTDASWTGDPQRFANPGMSVPHFLPEDCGTSTGTGNPAKEAMLTYCAEASLGDTTCDWYAPPKRPSPTGLKVFPTHAAPLALPELSGSVQGAPPVQ